MREYDFLLNIREALEEAKSELRDYGLDHPSMKQINQALDQVNMNLNEFEDDPIGHTIQLFIKD